MLQKLEEKRNRDSRNQKLVNNREIRRMTREECNNLNKIEIIDLILPYLVDGSSSFTRRALKVYNEKALTQILGIIRTREDINSYSDLIRFMKSYRRFSKDVDITFKGMNAKSLVNYIKGFSPKRKNQKLNYKKDNIIKIDE